MQEFIASACPILVVGVSADTSGSLRIKLEHDHLIEVCTEESTDGEQWRFFRPFESGAHVASLKATFAKNEETG